MASDIWRYLKTTISHKGAAGLGWIKLAGGQNRIGGPSKLDAKWGHWSGYRLEHCGHPTALTPWAMYDPRGAMILTGAVSGNPAYGTAWPNLATAMHWVAEHPPAPPAAPVSVAQADELGRVIGEFVRTGKAGRARQPPATPPTPPAPPAPPKPVRRSKRATLLLAHGMDPEPAAPALEGVPLGAERAERRARIAWAERAVTVRALKRPNAAEQRRLERAERRAAHELEAAEHRAVIAEKAREMATAGAATIRAAQLAAKDARNARYHATYPAGAPRELELPGFEHGPLFYSPRKAPK